jgi:hypothetical protein
MTPHDAIAKGRERTSRLVAAVAPFFPRDIPTTRRHDDWAVTGPAFIARSTRLVQALLELPNEHESAAGVLVRVLHEHVTTFAWIAIDPPKNLPQWVRRDRAERLKADNDMVASFGVRLLDPARKAEFEAERDAIPDGWQAMPGMAEQADRHWAARVKEFSTDRNGLRGMYVIIYRQFSTLVHGMPESLHRVVGQGPRPGACRVGVKDDLTEFNAFTIAPFVYALGLLVSGEVQGFPTRQSVIDALR